MTQFVDAAPAAPHAAAIGRTAFAAARALVASLFIVSGIQKAAGFAGVAAWIAGEGVPLASLVLAATVALEVIGGAALMLGFRVRLVAWALAAFVVVASIVFHDFWAVAADQVADQLTHFLKNVAIVGGLFLLGHAERRDGA